MASSGILGNIRILDFSWVLAGPYATRLLADFGAEVIKVQPPLPEADDEFSRGYYNTWNRNKLSINLNLNRSDGVEIARKLVKISDAVVENFSPRVMSNWGLDFNGLRIIKPDIIMLSLSVMGHSGPWRDYTGFGPTVQAFSGITGLTAYPHQPPVGLGYAYADHIAGLYASLAILNALEYRRRTGEGRFIDLSQVETMTSFLADDILSYQLSNNEPIPTGNSSDSSAPHGVFRCRGEDRWCAISVTTEEEWKGFKRAIGCPDWANDIRFATLYDRLKNADIINNLVEEWTQSHTAEEIMSKLQLEEVPSGMVRNAADLAQDTQLQARDYFVRPAAASPETITTDAQPIRLEDNPTVYRKDAPAHGQDNDYVYHQLLGLSEDEVDRLKREKVI